MTPSKHRRDLTGQRVSTPLGVCVQREARAADGGAGHCRYRSLCRLSEAGMGERVSALHLLAFAANRAACGLSGRWACCHSHQLQATFTARSSGFLPGRPPCRKANEGCQLANAGRHRGERRLPALSILLFVPKDSDSMANDGMQFHVFLSVVMARVTLTFCCRCIVLKSCSSSSRSFEEMPQAT